MRYKLRSLLFAVTVLSCLLALGTLFWKGLADAHPAAVRNAYSEGRITFEQAREEIGDRVDNWPEYVHERARVKRNELQNGYR